MQRQSADEDMAPANELGDETSFQKSTYWLLGGATSTLLMEDLANPIEPTFPR